MKIPKTYVGKYVEITWRDPYSKRVSAKNLPRGWDALATWKERGVIHSIIDGIACIIHSHAYNPPHEPERDEELMATWVPEDLVESCTVFEPVAPVPVLVEKTNGH